MNPRLWPDGFLATMAGLGIELERDLPGLVESYELMAETAYFGGEAGEIGRASGRREGWWFGDSRLLGPKAGADRRLQEVARAVRAWAAARQGS